MLAGLQGIPREHYEAAAIDGAGRRQRFRHITIPGLRHTLLFVTVISVIASLQVFDQVFVMTRGGPLFATESLVTYMYHEGFELFRMGYASAIAWILFCSFFDLGGSTSALPVQRCRLTGEDEPTRGASAEGRLRAYREPGHGVRRAGTRRRSDAPPVPLDAECIAQAAGRDLSVPDELLPREPTLAAYGDVWDRIPFARFFLNSVVFAGGVTAISLLFNSLAAYALARLQFRGRKLFFWLVLIVLMVPFQITLIPLFLTVFQFGWLDSFAGLIIPRATNAFGIFMLRQFFLTLPRDFDDAARVDGASEFRIYWQIVLPLSLPALATLALFHFMYNWNDFLWPLVITSSPEMRTLPAGLTLFMGCHVLEHALLMAGATIRLASLPWPSRSPSGTSSVVP